jgi:dinuclear metal center YbgI/SA1388 family protein
MIINTELKQIINILERFAPPRIASFDNQGIIVDFETPQKITKIALTLDPTLKAINQAIREKCQMIITHHGIREDGMKELSILDNKRIKLAKDNNIIIFRMHLNLDFCKNGIQKQFCKIIGLNNALPVTTTYEGHILKTGAFIFTSGITLDKIVKNIKELSPSSIRIFNPHNGIFKRVAITAGEGMPEDFIEQLHPDLFISGEFNHFAMLRAQDLDITLIEITHFASENTSLKMIAKEFTRLLKIPIIHIDSMDPELLSNLSVK